VSQAVWCEGEDLTLYVTALNVSSGGMFVRTAKSLGVGHQFRVSFTDKAEGEVVADVEVAWGGRDNGATGMGLKILDFLAGGEAYCRIVERQLAESAMRP